MCHYLHATTGLQALHNANYGHTAVRWEHIIQSSSVCRLILLAEAAALHS